MEIKFAERLKELREEKGLSQNQLAKQLGIAQTAIGYWEKNARVPSIKFVVILANYFNVSVGYMVGTEK